MIGRRLKTLLIGILTVALLSVPMQHVLADTNGCESQAAAIHADHAADPTVDNHLHAGDCATCMVIFATVPLAIETFRDQGLTEPRHTATLPPPTRDLRPPKRS